MKKLFSLLLCWALLAALPLLFACGKDGSFRFAETAAEGGVIVE